MASQSAPLSRETLIKRAAALRVKYTIGAPRLVPLATLGVHPQNRSGVYPQVGRLLELMQDIFASGFTVEQAHHAGVCVQEYPEDHSKPANYKSMHEWNLHSVSRHEQLRGTFKSTDRVTLGTLSRSHLTIILKNILHKARWPWPDWLSSLMESKGDLINVTAVADVDKDLASVLTGGLMMEVLSWKLQKEEPNGCHMISQALNAANDIALATAETTAIATLAETVTFAITNSQLSQAASRTLAYNAVLQSVSAELKNFVKQDDFHEVFQFVMEMGANDSPFIPFLKDYWSVFINSSTKRLPLAGFRNVNKMPFDLPYTKLAVVVRAYALDSNAQGLCQLPESPWCSQGAGFKKSELAKLEVLMRYFYEQLRSDIDAMGAEQALRLKRNVAVHLAHSFFKSASSKDWDGQGDPKKATTMCMLIATLPDHDQVRDHLHECGKLMPVPDEGSDWIDYGAARVIVEQQKETDRLEAEKREAIKAAKGGDPKQQLHAVCISYADGKALTQQQRVQTKGPSSTPPVEIPWREWLSSAVAEKMDIDKTETAVAHLGLHMFHLHEKLRSAPVKLEMDESTKVVRAIATRDIAEKELQIPPCAPGCPLKLGTNAPREGVMHAKILVEENRVQANPARRARLTAKKSPSEKVDSQKRTFYITADTRLPTWEDDVTAVADGNRHVRVLSEFSGNESLHIYWLLRRMTEKTLKQKNLEASKVSERLKFNCDVVETEVGVSVNGDLMNAPGHLVWRVTMPMITNTQKIAKGAELLIQVTAIKKEKNEEPAFRTAFDDLKRAKGNDKENADNGKAAKKAKTNAKDGSALRI